MGFHIVVILQTNNFLKIFLQPALLLPLCLVLLCPHCSGRFSCCVVWLELSAMLLLVSSVVLAEVCGICRENVESLCDISWYAHTLVFLQNS